MSAGGNKSADEAVSDALLEKLRNHAAKPQETGDALRTTVAKIHARITSSGMCFLSVRILNSRMMSERIVAITKF